MIRYVSVIPSENFYYIKNSLTYSYDELDITISIGDIVVIPFGNKKILNGIVVDYISHKPEKIQIKNIISKTDNSLDPFYIQISKTISKYYFTSHFLSLRLFLPKKIWNNLFTEKKEVFWTLKSINIDLIRGEKQIKIINLLKEYSKLSHNSLIEKFEIGNSSIQNLFTKNIIQKHENFVSYPFNINKQALKNLNEEQDKALSLLKKNPRSLIYGVTGSGKTEVFLHFFTWIFESNNNAQCLLLVPEIALTTQMIKYFAKAFGDGIVVIHSKISERKKCEIWCAVKRGDIKFVIGSRSSIFLPFKHLQAIVIDEEHEWTYKSENSPRYHTHFIAEKLLFSKNPNNKFLIHASATPDICSTYKSHNNNFCLIKLNSRVNKVHLPKVHMVDMRDEYKRKNSKLPERIEDN